MSDLVDAGDEDITSWNDVREEDEEEEPLNIGHALAGLAYLMGILLSIEIDVNRALLQRHLGAHY